MAPYSILELVIIFVILFVLVSAAIRFVKRLLNR